MGRMVPEGLKRTDPAERTCLGILKVEELPLSSSHRSLTFWGVLALVLLRLGLGWHFFKEGSKKFQGDKFTSVYFWAAAKGPWAETFKNMIPDRYGRERLADPERMLKIWTSHKDKIARFYNFDAKQMTEASQVVDRYRARLDAYLETNKEVLSEYFLEVERLEKAKKEPMREIPFRRDWIATKETELRGKMSGWVKDVGTLDQQLQVDVAALATPAQAKRGVFTKIDAWKPWQDTVVKYAITAFGVLLILGLFTRLAAFGAIGFLLSVISTQPPWVYDADTQYFYYQMVEILALLVVAAMAAGRFAGLDYVLQGLWARCCSPKKAQA